MSPIKHVHEIRDPIHLFIRLTTDERKILDSAPLQRLRHIHQLGLSYLVYPGATHRRFEHSLGVMELATRIYDVVTRQDNIRADIRAILPEISDDKKLGYWRDVLRVAALLHDVGHLPFSHSAESELLPEGWTHERLSRQIIQSDMMKPFLDEMTPPLKPTHVVKLAVGPNKAKDLPFSPWEAILSEIIVGDAFGADRIDYLLRDSHHTGVAYGRFDHYRLIDTLRILPSPQTGSNDPLQEPNLGVERGGFPSAESLLWARYLMFTQIYFHHVRLIYDIHLKDFLNGWLPNGKFEIEIENLIQSTDNEISAALSKSARDPSGRGHGPAKRIIGRGHFKLLYEQHPDDLKVDTEPGRLVYNEACQKFGHDNVRHYSETVSIGGPDFPVMHYDGVISSSISMSHSLVRIPPARVEYVFVDGMLLEEAREWLKDNRVDIIRKRGEEEA